MILVILAVGAALRLWGISERHFTDPDTMSHFMGGDVYRVTWRWYHDTDRSTPLKEYVDREMGSARAASWFDNGKPLNLIIRAGVIFLTGTYSIIAHSLLDIFFALVAMGLMLLWCHRRLGPRIALIAGGLWLVNSAQFQCTGRGYDYSAMLLCGTLAWLAFMQRSPGRICRYTFLAGLSMGAGITYHYSFFNYLLLLGVFVLFYSNPAGIKGKLMEIVAFVAGFAVFPLLIIGWYRWLEHVTGAAEWKWGILNPLFQQGNTYNDLHLSVGNFANSWFLWTYMNGYAFMLFLLAGLVVIAILHFQKYRWRWSICDDPLFILNGVAGFGLLAWGLYHTTLARIQIPEMAVWPVVAAIGIHHTTRFVGDRVLRGRGIALGVAQAVLVALIMAEQLPHTVPLVRMGAGLRQAMTAISGEGKTAMGEGCYYGIWPCTSRPLSPEEPVPPLTRWECLDDHLRRNGYDYFYVDYGRVIAWTVMLPGAGHPLMLETYGRLLAKKQPVYHFEYGASVNARLDCMGIGWLRQWRSPETWRSYHPQPTAYDPLVKRVPYVDVFRASDVAAAFRESRVALLAQLLILQQREPARFQEVAPRFHGFIQYNITNSVIMKEAQDVATRMTRQPGR